MKLLLLFFILRGARCSPTMEDNKLPTDQELGQPEEVASLGLPTDEESFNRLSVLFNPSRPTVFGSPTSGTYHFVSSTFPEEVDARGFHESVFDGIGDYFPSWPAPYKRGVQLSQGPSLSLAQRLGLQPYHKLRKRSEPWTEQPSVARNKRSIQTMNSSQELSGIIRPTEVDDSSLCTHGPCGRDTSFTKHLEKREAESIEEVEGKEHGRSQSAVVDEYSPGNSFVGFDKRSGARNVRGMEMGSSGFHGDVFNGDFGDFTTMRKRLKGSMGFHGDTFSDGFGDFATMKRSLKKKRLLSKLKDYLWKITENDGILPEDQEPKTPLADEDEDRNDFYDNNLEKGNPEITSVGLHGDTFSGGFGDLYPVQKRIAMGSSGFHGDTFSQGFGDFNTFKKRRPNAGSMGFHGDTFSQGFGDFDTVKKRRPNGGSMGFHGDTFSQGFGDFDTFKKRRANAGSMGFHGDTFSQGFGDFDTFKKRRPNAGSMGFHGDTFSQGFGDFDTVKKRRPNAGSMGFHGDTFSQGFGDFDTFKKRYAMGSSGFHGDTFSQGFGDFNTFKKRRPNAGSMGFHGDTFSQGFGDFDTVKKRRPNGGSMGFHGDTFSQGFGDFDTVKKRRPNGGSMGFHGDTFSQGFGDFDTVKKRRPNGGSMGFHGDTFSQGFGDFDTLKKKKQDTDSMGYGGLEVLKDRSPSINQGEILSDQSSEERKTEENSSLQRHDDDRH